MRKALDIAHLPRSARIRCRPLLFPPLVRRAANNALRREELEYSGSRRAEQDDYELALELSRQRQKPSRTPPKTKKTLPSLLSNTGTRKAVVKPPQAGPSSTGGAVASRKGKEKAEPQEEVSLPPPSQTAPLEVETPKAGPSRNPVGVQLLSPSLHRQLFPGTPLPKPPDSLLEISKSHLKDNGLSPEGAAVLPEINLDMPRLQGRNIREHFLALGKSMAEPYLSLARDFSTAQLPPLPPRWELSKPGWTRYGRDGSVTQVQDLGNEKMVSFDVEVLYKLSPYPVLATAASPDAWYSWISPTVFDRPPSVSPETPKPWEDRVVPHHPHDLIPLFSSDTPRIVIGHNVGYDRARVAEEYDLERTATRWIDTLSLHVATRGITSVQRPAWMAHRKNKREKLAREAEAVSFLQEEAEQSGNASMLEAIQAFDASQDFDALQKRWEDVTSVNSLAEVAALHCGHPVDKSIRDRFGDESITHASQIRNELETLMTYCANDTRITHDVYKKVLPLFFNSCPHPASFAGVLSMGNSFLPVNESWKEYLKNAEATYRELDEGVKRALKVLAEKLRREGHKAGDAWLDQLDRTPKAARWPENLEDMSTPASTPVSALPAPPVDSSAESAPAWYAAIRSDPSSITSVKSQRNLLPLILRMSYKGFPVVWTSDHYWCFKVPQEVECEYFAAHGPPVELGEKDKHLHKWCGDFAFFRISSPNASRKTKLTGPSVAKDLRDGILTCPYPDLLPSLKASGLDNLQDQIWKCAEDLRTVGEDNDWAAQLDWSASTSVEPTTSSSDGSRPVPAVNGKKKAKTDHGTWPKWYWDLTSPISAKSPAGEIDLTTKKTVAPLLLRLQWQGHPLVFSREHKWLYRISRDEYYASTDTSPRGAPVIFGTIKGDEALLKDSEHVYFRLPHKDGEGKNVGNPMSKSFVKYIESGELSSGAAEDGDDIARKAASDATNMNVLCSYWISSRERIMDQMVVYKNGDPSRGMILPQVITMGTVTRRAVEATWLTASNAKKNRVGSELKAMVRAPPGYSIVGADVDSEELWISSVMGDSQFGLHGATAIGWMTLEGTKSAGTDLHSKTANILGISRDAAKVFNYSRIYGAGQKHAVQLLMQGDSSLSKAKAEELAKDLYKATKGSKAARSLTLPPAALPTLWHGGSESYLFNTLEAIALSDRPTTPALGCGVTRALRKSYLEEGTSYLPSRINWVVQSSGVDYLHLLIVSMEYLLRTYNIKARYLLSVHDEVRYLASEEDRYRCALALQIANAWTRALFCYNLGIDNMPQGIAFFSAVDVDHVLRKEVFMSCETPSHPTPIPAGESLDIGQLLEKTGLYLGQPSPAAVETVEDTGAPVKLFKDIASPDHRTYLSAQAQSVKTEAKRWLAAQPALAGFEDIPLKPAREKVKQYRRKKLEAFLSDYDAGGDLDEYVGGFDSMEEINWAEIPISSGPAVKKSAATRRST